MNTTTRESHMDTTFITNDAATLVAQIGRMNILGISGGRITYRSTGITLPVAHGYRVTVDLNADDTYTCRRVFTRGTKTWIKKEWAGVHADQIGDIAYQASCYMFD